MLPPRSGVRVGEIGVIYGKRTDYIPVCGLQTQELHSMKNKKTSTERLELKKFCPFCRKHVGHKEIK